MITTTLLVAALAAGAPAPEPASFALVVASNRGLLGARAPLQYADDDGAKYHTVLAAVAGAENTVLLTELDADTARLFPALAPAVRPPTRANVAAAGERLAAAAARARAAGRPVRFYFVYAGHGDVDDGRGFLELADGPFTSSDLRDLLLSVRATEAHVILDSCNSYFVVNPRRAGGRRFPTPRDAADALARALPDVGVFLSTSAQAEVYEWSELQSGVFSHAVRSGLLGAADADRDGRVSYEELAAFVDVAAAEIRNPLFRPRVFARGPNGDAGRAILEAPRARRPALAVAAPGEVRLAARDRHGLRWADAYKEDGAALELWFPPALAGRLEIERLRGDGAAVEATYALPDRAEAVELSGLDAAAVTVASRGAGDIFRALFARPFGPRALADHRAALLLAPEPAAPPEGFDDAGGRSSAFREVGVTYLSLRGGGMGLPRVADQPLTGVHAAAVAGRELYPFLSGELAVGVATAARDGWRFGYPGVTYVNEGRAPAKVSFQLVPLTLTAKLVLPAGSVRPYLLAGAGLMLATVGLDPSDARASLRDARTVGEAHAGGGFTVSLNEQLRAGIEARYSIARAWAFEHRFDLNRLEVGATVGFRFDGSR